MKKFLKYGVVPVVVGIFLLFATVMLLPVLVNVQKFLPQIEKQVMQATGRPFSVGSDFGLTFFPWMSVTFSDMRLGNPEGVAADDFIQVDSFEARVKLLPLLAGRFEFSRFVVSGLNINLQREQNGRNNWHILPEKQPADAGDKVLSRVSGLFSGEFFIKLFAITGGSLTWSDRQQGSNYQIDDLMILANNVSSTGSARVDFKARTGTREVSGAGNVGPFSSNPASVFMDMRLQLGEQIQAIVNGTCSSSVKGTLCDLDVKLPSFYLVELCRESGDEKDNRQPGFLGGKSIEVDGHFLGNHKKYSVNKGSGTIDGQSFTYELRHDASQQQINKLELNFNSVNLDRYFADENSQGDAKDIVACTVWESLKKTPFTGKIKGRELILADIHFGAVSMDVSGREGTLSMSNGEFSLNEGKGRFAATAGLGDLPVSLESRIEMERVQAEPLSKQLIGFPFLSGLVKADVILKRSALPGSDIGKGFAAHGRIELDGGSIAGIDLLSTDGARDEKKTEFTKLSADFVMEDGVVRLQPLIFVGAEGISEMSAVVQVENKSFRILSDRDGAGGEVLSLSGSYGPDGLAVVGFTDVHEAKVGKKGGAQAPVAEKMSKPGDEDVENITGTPLIDPAIVAHRSGVKATKIPREKGKKSYTVGEGRVKIHPLQELESATFLE